MKRQEQLKKNTAASYKQIVMGLCQSNEKNVCEARSAIPFSKRIYQEKPSYTNSNTYVSCFEKPNPLVIEIIGTPQLSTRSICVTSKFVLPQPRTKQDTSLTEFCTTYVR